jgi:hypothetical protein
MLAVPSHSTFTVLPVQTPFDSQPDITSQYVPAGKHVWNRWVVFLIQVFVFRVALWKYECCDQNQNRDEPDIESNYLQ